ncbi:MAG: hypothetical protein ABIL14_01365 [candidate division WOR-3 bacterium]
MPHNRNVNNMNEDNVSPVGANNVSPTGTNMEETALAQSLPGITDNVNPQDQGIDLRAIALLVGRMAAGHPEREKQVQEVLGRLNKNKFGSLFFPVSKEAQEMFPVLSTGKPGLAQSLVKSSKDFIILDTKTGKKTKSKVKPTTLGPFEILIKDNEILLWGERARE